MKRLRNKILHSQFRKDILLTLISQIVIMLSAFIINKLLSTGLGVDNYGYYSIIKKTSSVIAFVILSGMGIALPRYISYYKAINKKRLMEATIIGAACIVLGMACFIFIILLFFEPTLSYIIIGSDNRILYLLTISFSFSIALSSFLYSLYRGNGNFIKFSVSQFVVQIILLILCLISRTNLLLLLFFWSCSTLLISGILVMFELKKILSINRQKINLIKIAVKELSIYGFPRLLGDFSLFSFTAAPLIIINMKSGISDSAFFSVGITLMSMISPLFAFLGTTLLPHVSELFAKNEGGKIRRIVSKLLLIYCILSIVISLIIYFKINFFISMFFCIDYIASANVCQIIICSILPQSIYLLLRNPLDSISKVPYNTFNLLISFIVLLGLFFFSQSLIEFGFSFLISFSLLAVLSFISWEFCCRKYKLI